MKRLNILRSAKHDLADGFEFYESQDPGVGEYFLESLAGQIEELKTSGGIHRLEYAGFHRMVCRPFPYAVYYTTNAESVTVYAVVDCRRDLEWIHQHLDET